MHLPRQRCFAAQGECSSVLACKTILHQGRGLTPHSSSGGAAHASGRPALSQFRKSYAPQIALVTVTARPEVSKSALLARALELDALKVRGVALAAL